MRVPFSAQEGKNSLCIDSLMLFM